MTLMLQVELGIIGLFSISPQQQNQYKRGRNPQEQKGKTAGGTWDMGDPALLLEPTGISLRHMLWTQSLILSQELQKRIPGSQVKVYNASSLYNNPDSLEAMHSGTLEACWASMSKISGILPQGLAGRLPALFSTYEQALAIPQTALGKYIEKGAIAKGFVWLGWGVLSPYSGVGAKERILKIEDWKGKKVRCYDKITQVIEVKLAGGAPTVMPWGDFVPAVQSGVVDAGFTSLSSWGPVKETVPFFTCIGIVPDYYPFLVAQRWWKSLSPATQNVIQEVASQACEQQRNIGNTHR